MSSVIWNGHFTSISPRNRVLLEKLICPHIIKKFAVFYGVETSVVMFWITHHWSLLWDTWMESESSHSISVTSVLILMSHLLPGLQTGCFIKVFYFFGQTFYAVLVASSRRLLHPSRPWFDNRLMKDTVVKYNVMQFYISSCYFCVVGS